jgi:hypothetical protein
MSTQPEPDKEILAITAVYAALKELDAPAQSRVIEYVLKKLNLPLQASSHEQAEQSRSDETASTQSDDQAGGQNESHKDSSGDEFTGISPVAQRWIQRNGLRAEQLSSIFSLGGDEIDLVANKVPGKSSRAKMRSVFLLKGVAAYLGGGAARFAHDKVKETCVHYDAYDSANFAKHLKEFAPEISGSKESGYTLTARGLANAAGIVKEMLGLNKAQ